MTTKYKTELSRQRLANIYKNYKGLTFNDLSESVFWRTMELVGCDKQFEDYIDERRSKECVVK